MRMPGSARAFRRREFPPTIVERLRIVWKWIRRKPKNICDSCGSAYYSVAPRYQHVCGFPFPCKLCGYPIESVDDRIEWHGLGNCVFICDDCDGSGEVSADGGYGFPALCKPCGGRGWFPMPPAERRPETRELIAESDARDEERRLGFPNRPIVPTRDAHFGED